MRNAYPRQRLADGKERVVCYIVAMPDKHDVRPEIPGCQQQFAVGDHAAYAANPERREKARHVAIRKLAYAPVIAYCSAHELAPWAHPEVSVPADHRVVHEKYAMGILALFHAVIISHSERGTVIASIGDDGGAVYQEQLHLL